MKRYCEIVILILAIAFCSSSRPVTAPELEKLAIGHSNLRNDIAALWVPKEIGIFRKNGLDANIVLITGGQRMTQALLSASAPLGFTGTTPVVIAPLKLQDVVDTSIIERLEQSGSIRSESVK